MKYNNFFDNFTNFEKYSTQMILYCTKYVKNDDDKEVEKIGLDSVNICFTEILIMFEKLLRYIPKIKSDEKSIYNTKKYFKFDIEMLKDMEFLEFTNKMEKIMKE